MARDIEKIVKKAARNMNTKQRSDYYNFGFKYFGPFLFGFTKWLDDNLTAAGLEKIFFFARDGYEMQKAFSVLHPDLKTEYVYFSRKSLRQAMLWKCSGYESSLKYLTYAKFISVAALLEYYGFDSAERREISEKLGISLTDDLDYFTLKDNKEGKRLYEENAETINAKSREQYDILKLYLEQIGMEGNTAIIDIGWIGSMQYALEEFIRQNDLDVSLHGYYVGIKTDYNLEGSFDGYLYSQQNPALRKSLLCFFGGLEKLFQSLEGSTEGYRLENGTVVPKLAPYEYEGDEKIQFYIRELQQGSLDFVTYAVTRNFEDVKVETFAEPLIEFGKNPPLWGVRLFRFFYNIDGNKQYFVSQKPLMAYRPKELLHALSNSVWKTGFMKSVFKLPLPYYRVYELMKK